MKSYPEAFKIKSTEPISLPSREHREKAIKDAHYNLFNLHAKDIFIDLLTDSGTGAMSAAQWAAVMMGDESYAGSRSFEIFEETVKEITGLPYIVPVHQGRGAEHILFSVMAGPDDTVPSNAHFDTTRANIEVLGAKALDLAIDQAQETGAEHPFKGNMDVVRLRSFFKRTSAKHIPVAMLTITNNTAGGQPVSMENIREVSKVAKEYNVPLFFDACRFAENAYFIKTREKGFSEKSVKDIVKEMFSYVSGCTMSAKKDGLANIGGFIALRDETLLESVKNQLVIYEGFPTYGGLAGRDLEAIAVGLKEVLDEGYLKTRIEQVERFGKLLIDAGVPVLVPIGGHAVYVEAKDFLAHIAREEYPGQALSVALYLEGAVRACEIGGVMFEKKDPQTGKKIFPHNEFVRLAVPRRVYTDNHLAYVAEVFERLKKNKSSVRGVRIVDEKPFLRHFTAKFDLI